jgi:hypothetical protein
MEIQNDEGPQADFAAWEADVELERELAALKEEASHE